MTPLVSCVMLTFPGRERFAAEARGCFEAQTYPNLELVVVDCAGAVGAKRNMGASRSRGEIIAHWDDDDWSHPERIAKQVGLLLESGAEICGVRDIELWDDKTGERWLYTGAPGYLVGTSLLYHKEVWRRHPFEPLQIGEDTRFIRGRRTVAHPDHWMCRARIHAGNTSRKRVECAEYKRLENAAAMG